MTIKEFKKILDKGETDKMRKEELLKLCRHGNKSYYVKN